MMALSLEAFGLRIESEWLTPNHESFRPHSWPPTDDWVVSEDKEGNVLSRWGDPIWDISPWAGVSMRLDFGTGNDQKTSPLDIENSYLLRILTTWRIWGIKGCVAANTLKGNFLAIRRIISHCSKAKIKATDLPRFPRVLDDIAKAIPKSEFSKTILEFHRLWDAREYIGFYIMDPSSIERLAITAPAYDIEQTAYIPPRIWAYQVERLKECIDDFNTHSQSIVECFNFCISAYIQNFGSITNSLAGKARHRLPFWTPKRPGKGSQSGCIYLGPFALTANRYGISELIEKWIGVPPSEADIRNFSAYLSLVQYACMAYIANFTLQRINEVASLRVDCLIWEVDEKLGRIPLICGETTKTDKDSDARWPTSPSIEAAVKAISLIANLRMISSQQNPAVNPTVYDIKNPYIFGASNDPWTGGLLSPYRIRPHVGSYSSVLKRYPMLLEEDKMRITEEDLRIAQMLTPGIQENSRYAVGEAWPIAWHQLRRTVAVNMFASNLLSDSTMQFQMKHASRLMPLYYGRGYTKLHLNEDVEDLIIESMYEAMAHKLRVATTERFVSPLGQDRKEAILVSLVSTKDIKQLSSASRNGSVHFREMRIGACTHRGTCTYGGIESISRCAGGDGNGPCADALYDKAKQKEIEYDLSLINQELSSTNVNSPRYKSLLAERQGMENYLNVIRN